MNKFMTRALSGIIYAAVIILAISFGGWAVYLLASVFAVIGVCEFDRMNFGLDRQSAPAVMLDVAGVLALVFGFSGVTLVIWLALLILRMVVELALKNENPVKCLAAGVFGQLYLGIPFGLMAALETWGRLPESAGSSMPTFHMLVLLVFFLLWLNDSGAYIVGSMIGRHKMFERISPKKTWEGFFGGVALALIGAAVFCLACPGFFSLSQFGIGVWLALAAIVCVFGTWGDLVESMFKRSLGLKDSGNWIPGHGGLLDRIDSFLLAYPASILFFLLVIF